MTPSRFFRHASTPWFESPSFKGVTTFTETLPVSKHQRSLLHIRPMSSLLLENILSIFLHNPAYKCDGFKMWGRILKR